MKQYTVNFFINKFEAIPEDRWLTNLYGSDGKHCALGHCGVGYGHYTEESTSIARLFNLHLNATIISINDGSDGRYPQPTPKQRILAALYDIKKLQYPELSETTVEELISEKELEDNYGG